MKIKLNLSKISLAVLSATLGWGISGGIAHASAVGTVLNILTLGTGGVTTSILNGILSFLAYTLLSISGWFLSLAGVLLNVSMFLTTHLGIFITNTPVIYIVWNIIRDLSSILLIFFILYAAIQMIIGLKSPGFGNMIKNIIIVGILINFSFFFTQVLIDASNIASLEFYDAIAPQNTASTITANSTLSTIIPQLMTSGGISDAIMGSLKVQSWWQNNTANFTTDTSQAVTNTGNIIMAAAGGIVVTWITILSFVAISAVAILRLAMLIFLLAFSPIWVASWGMPQLKELTKKWTGQFYAHLIFLPVYLAFLYVALRIVTASNLINTGGTSNTPGMANLFNMAVGFAIIIVMLNIPMVAAMAVAASFGGDTGMIKKWSEGTRSKVGSWVGRNTIGRGAASLGDSAAARAIYNRAPVLGRYVSKGLTNVSSSGFGGGKKAGYDQVHKARVEDYKKLADRGNLSRDEQDHIDEFMKGDRNDLPGMVGNMKKEYGELRGNYELANAQKTTMEQDKTAKQTERKDLLEKQKALAQQMEAPEATEAQKKNLAAQSEVLTNQIKLLQDEISETGLKITAKDKDIENLMKQAKNAPKNARLEKYKQGGKTAREIYRASTKEKDPTEDLMAAIKGLKDDKDKPKT